MVLSTHKFPIIPTINDQPSVAGQEEHPNASLLCKNFNDLIDELTTSIGGGTSTPIELPSDLYLDTSLSVNGDGSEANPFNNVASLYARINNNIIANSYVFIRLINSVVDLGDIKINAIAKQITTHTLCELIFTPSDGITPIEVTFSTIDSNIPINFGSHITVKEPITRSILINNSSVWFIEEVIGNDSVNPLYITALNSIIKIGKAINVNFNLEKSAFRAYKNDLTQQDCYFETVAIKASFSTIYLVDVTIPPLPPFSYSLYIDIESSIFIMEECTIANYSGSFLYARASDIKIANSSYSYVDTEFSFILNTNFACSVALRNSPTFAASIGNANYKIINGVLS